MNDYDEDEKEKKAQKKLGKYSTINYRSRDRIKKDTGKKHSKSNDKYKLNKAPKDNLNSTKSFDKHQIENKSVSNRSGHSSIVENRIGFHKDLSTNDNLARYLKR